MSAASRLFHSVLPKRTISRIDCLLSSSCALHLFGGVRLASHQIKDFRSTHCSTVTYEKWPVEKRTEVNRAFQQMKFLRRLKAAARVGLPNPEQNPNLAGIIEEAKKQNVVIPVEQVIDIALHHKARAGIYEIAAPFGTLLVAQHETVDISLAEHNVKEICQKYDFVFVGTQSRRLVFYDQKGILVATSTKNGAPLESDEAAEMALKASAESVIARLTEDENLTLEIYCNPSKLHDTKRQLENLFVIEEAFVGFIPKSHANLSDTQKSKVADFIVDLSKLPVIDMLYENVK